MELVAAVRTVKQFLTFAVNGVFQRVVAFALLHELDWVEGCAPGWKLGGTSWRPAWGRPGSWFTRGRPPTSCRPTSARWERSTHATSPFA